MGMVRNSSIQVLTALGEGMKLHNCTDIIVTRNGSFMLLARPCDKNVGVV